MVTKYGMSDKLGPMVFGNDNEEVFLGRDFATSRNFSEGVAEQIDDEIMGIIDACYKKAIDILTEHMDKLHEVARILYLNEKMDGDEFEALFAKEPVPIESADIVADKQAETRADEEIKRDDIDVPPPKDGQE